MSPFGSFLSPDIRKYLRIFGIYILERTRCRDMLHCRARDDRRSNARVVQYARSPLRVAQMQGLFACHAMPKLDYFAICQVYEIGPGLLDGDHKVDKSKYVE